MDKRIYQIAKELNISHVQILKFLKSKDITVINHMAFVDNDIYDSILLEFSKEKKQVDRSNKEKARRAITTINKNFTKQEVPLFSKPGINLEDQDVPIVSPVPKPPLRSLLMGYFFRGFRTETSATFRFRYNPESVFIIEIGFCNSAILHAK